MLYESIELKKIIQEISTEFIIFKVLTEVD